MDFEVDQERRELVDRYRAFVEEEIAPLEPRALGGPFSKVEAELETLRARARRAGLWGPNLPRDLGGLGLDLVGYGLVSEAIGGYPYAHYVFGCQAPDAGNIEILRSHGGGEPFDELLRALAEGEIRSCFAMTEKETPGSDPVRMTTTAVRDGEHYVIDGAKWYTTAADGARFAIVMAVTDPEAPPHRRASMLVVPTDVDGFERVRNISVMGEAGDGWASHAELRFDRCRVPVDHRLGGEGEGFAIAQQRLGPGRIHHCMRWLGIARRAFDLMCRRAVERTFEGGERLADKDIVRAWIAECSAEIGAARLLTLETAWRIDRDGWRAARREVSAIKFLVAAMMSKVVDRALQVHGSLGMSDDTPLAWFYREERAARIYDGPDEVHKLALARRILDDYS